MNANNLVFVVTEGKLLGFIISKDGMIINLEISKAIAKLRLPSLKKAMQYFIGKNNFFRRFVPNFTQIVRPLQDLIKKYVLFQWYDTQKDAFINIRKAIMDYPTLMPPNFEKKKIYILSLLIFVMLLC